VAAPATRPLEKACSYFSLQAFAAHSDKVAWSSPQAETRHPVRTLESRKSRILRSPLTSRENGVGQHLPEGFFR
jgi:hypothetical protein